MKIMEDDGQKNNYNHLLKLLIDPSKAEQYINANLSEVEEISEKNFKLP
jgi:hypothetical protein